MTATVRRWAIVVAAALGCLVALGLVALGLGAGPAGAQETTTTTAAPTGPAVGGTLRDADGEPVAGVELVVTLDGEEIGTATSDSAGTWRLAVPEPNRTYAVTIDTETLPEGVGLRDPDRDTLDAVRVRAGLKTVIFPLGQGAATAPPAWERILDLAAEGVRLGLVLAVASIGLSLIFGVTGLTNFAHGELVTFGALVAYLLSAGVFGLPLPLAALGAFLAGGLFGFAHDAVLFRPLRRRRSGTVSLIVVTIGLGLFLRNLYLILFEGRPRPYDQFTIQTNVDLGPISLRPKDFWVAAICIVVLVGVAVVLQRTRLGMSLRAVADQKDLAAASGIDVEGVVRSTWIGGAALAALGGVLFGITDTIAWDMGFGLLLLMFAAVVVGGLGTAYGAMVGGILIGVASQVSTYWISPKYRIGVALAVLIAAVLLRPQGILGRRERVG